ncbi:hypothetical protein RQP46_008693 [Phenoliferia psychrophenolica]
MHLAAWVFTLVACVSAVSALDVRLPDSGATLAKCRSTTVAGPCGRKEAGKDLPHTIKGGKKACVKCRCSATGVELYLTPDKHCFSKCAPGYIGDRKTRTCVHKLPQPAKTHMLIFVTSTMMAHTIPGAAVPSASAAVPAKPSAAGAGAPASL